MEGENSKYIILPEYITKDRNLTDKEKSIYSMILSLSKNQECIMSNSYISSMLNISKVHSSRLISSLRDKGYINVKIVYKENSKEMQLYDMLYEASEDGVLETKEFKFWCTDNYTTINSWFEHINTAQRNILIKEGKIEVKNGMKKYIATDELKQEAEELLGLKKFLLDYTLIAERQAIEVTLFEKYLIYAQMMGIAKQVAKEFKELYPEIIEQSSFGTYEDLIFITAYTSNYVTAVDTAISRANSYSSGGGGFSSGGRRRRLFRWWRWRRPEVSVKRKECDLT